MRPRNLLLTLAALLAAACGCSRRPQPVSAEFLDENHPDGAASQEESILLTLDQALAPDHPLRSIKVRADPPVEWTPEVLRTEDPRTLRVKILTGSPAFRCQGVHGLDGGSTGLGIDLGDGEERWVDLQLVQSLPVLEKAIWEDSSPEGGNLVVDRGDWIRLVFDRPVALQGQGAEPVRVRSPQDIVLSKPSDRLDDQEVHATFEPGDDEREVRIVLGSRPLLTIKGAMADAPGSAERFRFSAPSGLALNGTRILPMPKITDRRGGPGAISLGEVDVEFPPGFPMPEPHAGVALPAPGSRIGHTVTPIARGRALVVGGETVESRQAIDQVLVYDPFAEKLRGEAFAVAGRLARPAHSHTATALAGPDGVPRTADDAVLIAGGSEGRRSLADLTLIVPAEDGGMEVLALEAKLRVPRAEHAALEVEPNQVLIDGGRTRGWEGPPGLIECAEVVTLSFDGSQPHVNGHGAFRSLARMRHTLTLLPPARGGAAYVLAYGGFGRDRQRPARPPLPFGEAIVGRAGEDLIFPLEEGVVLVSPILIQPRAPAASITQLQYKFSFSLPRWGHAAMLLDGGPGGRGAPGSASVLLAGGSLRHLYEGLRGGSSLWEIQLSPDELRSLSREELRELEDILQGQGRPRGHEAASALLFRFDPEEPARSRLEVVPHPAPGGALNLERAYFSAVAIPDQALVLSGGEQPGEGREPQCLDGSEVFLFGEERLSELAVQLSAGRTRHQGYYLERGPDGGRSIILIGGATSGEGRPEWGDVEGIPLGMPSR